MGEVIVWNGNCSWTHNSINETISTIRKRVVINPNMAWTENGNGITISHSPPTIMWWWASNQGITSWFTIMNVETMNDNISNKLDSNTSPIRDMHVHTTSIYCFETIHDQFLLKCDVHITFKHYPQWLILNYSMTECSRSGIYWIIITRVSNNIKPARRGRFRIYRKLYTTLWICLWIYIPAISATNSVTSKTNWTVS